MARIPAGELELASSRRSERIAAFCLDRTEVTTAAYRACVTLGSCTAAGREPQWKGANRAQTLALGPACNGPVDERGQHPINCVTARQAQYYCESVGKRLPTAGEWQWAAQGGDQRRVYPWGDFDPTPELVNGFDRAGWGWLQERDLSWVAVIRGDDGHATTSPVASYAAGQGRWGVDDLAGNVWEWTSSSRPGHPGQRIVKGGSWAFGSQSHYRTDARGSSFEGARNVHLGFRCARDW